jgi:hypothetical protein
MADPMMNIGANVNGDMLGSHPVSHSLYGRMKGYQDRKREERRSAQFAGRDYENEAKMAQYKANISDWEMSRQAEVHVPALRGQLGVHDDSGKRVGGVAYGFTGTGGQKMSLGAEPVYRREDKSKKENSKRYSQLSRTEGSQFTLSPAQEEPGTPVDTPTTRLMQQERLKEATDVMMPTRGKATKQPKENA